MKLTAFVAAIAVVFASASAHAETAKADAVQAANLGPAVGEAIPHTLEIQSVDGYVRDFDTLKGDAGMALYFVRSVEWCPYCKTQAMDVSKKLKEFEKRGLSVVFVSYDSVEKQRKFVQMTDFKPTLLSDRKIDVINAFGIRNETAEEGTRFYGIPHPSVFLFDADGVLRAKFYEDDFLTNKKSYRNRPEIDLVLEGADAWLDSAES